MLRVIYANQLELLATLLGEGMPKDDPFATTEVVVSHPLVGRWLMLRLCQERGGVAGVNISLLDKLALQTATAQTARPIEPLSRAALTSLLCSELAEDQALAARLHVVAGARGEARRRVEAAEALAALFLDYARTRPDWLDAWGDGDLSVGIDEASAHLAWQPRLYRSLLSRAQRHLGGAVGDPLAVMAPRALRAVAKRTDRLELPSSPLHVLGFSYLAISDLELLQIFAKHREVIVYQLNPSADYWLDMPRRSGLFARQRAFAPDEAATASLRLWATPARDTIAWLLEHADEVDGVFARPTATRDTGLSRWQQRILARGEAAAPTEPNASTKPNDPMSGLHIAACPSPRRELEVAVDALLAELAADPSCALPETALLVAGVDADAYLAVAPLVLASRGLPYHLADAQQGGPASLADGLGAVLALAQRPVTKSSLLEILCHPGLGLATADQRARWPELAERLGIFVGVDGSDLADTYLADSGAAHWSQGLARLALGAFMAGPALGDWRGVELTPGGAAEAWLPADGLAFDAETAAGLIGAARGVLADRMRLAAKRASLTEWCSVMERLAEGYGDGDTLPGQDQLRAVVRALGTLARGDFDGRALGLDEFALRFGGAVCGAGAGGGGSAGAGTGQLLCDGVYVGLVSAMRPLPFRHVAIVGLADGAFPQPPRTNPLDLRHARRRGDVNAAEHDRQAFFDALLATRATATLCYSATDQVDGTPLAPSTVLTELARTLLPGVGGTEAMRRLAVRRSLYAWRDPLAPGEPSLRDAEAFAAAVNGPDRKPGVATFAALGAIGEASPWREVFGLVSRRPAAPEVPARISINALRAFLERPAEGWARIALGIAPAAEADEDALAADTEAFAAPPLDLSLVLREALDACWRVNARSPVAVADALKAAIAKRRVAGAWPLAGLGDAQLNRWQDRLYHWLTSTPLATPQGIRRWRLGAEVATPDAAPARLTVEFAAGGARHAIAIEGLTNPTGDVAGAVMMRLRGKASDAKAWLRLGLDRVVCAAAGLGSLLPGGVATLLLAPSEDERAQALAKEKPVAWYEAGHVPVWSQDDAMRYLQALLGDVFGGSHTYRIDANNPVKPATEPAPFASDYLDDNAFGPPADLEAIVARRYRPLLTTERWEACTATKRSRAAKKAEGA